MPYIRGRPKKPKIPFGSRPGGKLKPEKKPVYPKVPGTRDKMQPDSFATDPLFKKRRRRKI